MRTEPRLIEALRASRRVAVLTGAGMSAESGLPTFRDTQTGLWARFRPEDLATPEAMEVLAGAGVEGLARWLRAQHPAVLRSNDEEVATEAQRYGGGESV